MNFRRRTSLSQPSSSTQNSSQILSPTPLITEDVPVSQNSTHNSPATPLSTPTLHNTPNLTQQQNLPFTDIDLTSDATPAASVSSPMPPTRTKRGCLSPRIERRKSDADKEERGGDVRGRGVGEATQHTETNKIVGGDPPKRRYQNCELLNLTWVIIIIIVWK